MFNKKQLLLIIIKSFSKALVAMLIASVIVFFMSGQISRIGKTLQQKRTLSYILEKKTETTQTLKRDFETVGDKDRRIEAAFPPLDNVLDFVAILESLASQVSLQQSLRFGSPAPSPTTLEGKPLSTIDYSLTLNGNILTLLNYLKNFEALPYFTSISSLTINSGAEKGWEGDSMVSINARVYAK